MDRDVLVVPGRMYGPHAGMLLYAAFAAQERGARIRTMTWPDDPPLPDDPAAGAWVCGQVDQHLGQASLVIGKSLATLATPLVAERGVAAVWLTPLLTLDGVADGLRRATAPRLLVGGTADSAWDGAIARRHSPYVLEVEGADHGMRVPGPLANSTAVLGRMVTAIEQFLDDVAWRP